MLVAVFNVVSCMLSLSLEDGDVVFDDQVCCSWLYELRLAAAAQLNTDWDWVLVSDEVGVLLI